MTFHIQHMLEKWSQQSDKKWVMGVVTKTLGSSYRKAGAMIFISEFGQTLGLVSGGCLEVDVVRQAKKCFSTEQSVTLVYDLSDEESDGWQQGLGCGGRIEIKMIPLTAENHYLKLKTALTYLQQKQAIYWQLDLTDCSTEVTELRNQKASVNSANKTQLIDEHLKVYIQPVTHLAIFGAGADTLPMVNIAHQLGWKISVFDSRVNYANPELFQQVDQIYKAPLAVYSEGKDAKWFAEFDCAIVMYHNVLLDSKALRFLTQSHVGYIGVLGPKHRLERVMNEANIRADQLPCQVKGPMGFDIGGELPESIALSALAEIHACLHEKLHLKMRHQNDI